MRGVALMDTVKKKGDHLVTICIADVAFTPDTPKNWRDKWTDG